MGRWPLTCADAIENRCVMTSADNPAKDFPRTQNAYASRASISKAGRRPAD
jgi:hypothetical protein